MNDYSKLLKDPRWQQKRLSIFERDYWSCVHCGSDEKTLHAHHLEYRKGINPWDYDDDEIKTLCDDCHSKLHDCKKSIAKCYDVDLMKSFKEIIDLCDSICIDSSDIFKFIEIMKSNRREFEILFKYAYITKTESELCE